MVSAARELFIVIIPCEAVWTIEWLRLHLPFRLRLFSVLLRHLTIVLGGSFVIPLTHACNYQERLQLANNEAMSQMDARLTALEMKLDAILSADV